VRRLRKGKEKRQIEETTGQKYNVRICYAGRPYLEIATQVLPNSKTQFLKPENPGFCCLQTQVFEFQF